MKTSRKKSLFSMVLGGTYSYTTKFRVKSRIELTGFFEVLDIVVFGAQFVGELGSHDRSLLTARLEGGQLLLLLHFVCWFLIEV